MAQNDAFVDLAYRGLSLGRRIKLTQMRPSTGYLEHPTPMPVGTPVSIVTDDGLVIEAIVTHVHEQVGGSEKSPGMTVTPALADHKLAAWWTEHVSLPELDAKPAPERSRPVTVRPRTHTVPNPVVDAGGGVVAVASGDSARVEVTLPMPAPPLPPLPVIPMATPPAMTTPPAIARIELLKAEGPDTAVEDNNKKTMLMDAVDQELLEQLSRGSPPEIERLVRTTNEHPVVDDGQRTTVMDAVDPSSLGLEVSASGSMSAMDSGEIEDETNGEDDASQPVSANGDKKSSSGVKKRRKKRR